MVTDFGSRVGHPVGITPEDRPQGLGEVRAPGPGPPVSLTPEVEADYTPTEVIEGVEQDGLRGPEVRTERVEGPGPTPLDIPPQLTRTTQNQGMDTPTTSHNTQQQWQTPDTSHKYKSRFDLNRDLTAPGDLI